METLFFAYYIRAGRKKSCPPFSASAHALPAKWSKNGLRRIKTDGERLAKSLRIICKNPVKSRLERNIDHDGK